MKKKFSRLFAMSLCLTLILSANATTAFADEEYYTGDDAYNDYTYYGDDTYTDDSTDYYYSDDTYSDDYYSDDTYSEEYYSDDSTDYYSDDSTDYYSDDTTDYSDSTDYTTDSTDTTDTTDSTESSSSDDSSSSDSSSNKNSTSTKSTPNPNISVPSPGNNFYILDQAGVISSTVVKSIESQGEELYKSTGAQIVVVTIDSAGVNLKDYAYTLFKKWEIGGENGYGVLIVLSIKEDIYYSMSGSGLMNNLDNTALSSLNTTYLEPYFAEQKYSEGIDAIYPQIVTKVKAYMERSGNAVAQKDSSSSSESSETSESTQSSIDIKSILGTVARIIGIILIVCAVLALVVIGVFAGRRFYLKHKNTRSSRSSSRNSHRNSNRQRENSSRSHSHNSRNSSHSSRDHNRR